jgi:hypothetical protein
MAAMNLSPLRTRMEFLAAIAGLAFISSMALGQDGSLPLGQDTAAAKNLLVNGSFEKGLDGWTVDAHEKHGQATIDSTEMREGKPTLRVENAGADDTHVKQKITVEPNTRYRLEGYIKTKDAVAQGRQSKVGASLAVEGGFQRSNEVNRTKSWTRVAFDFSTGSETEIEVGARLGFYANLTMGIAWFSDLTLKKIGKSAMRR